MDEALSRFPLSAFPGAAAGRLKTNMLFLWIAGVLFFPQSFLVLTVQQGGNAVVIVKAKTGSLTVE